MEHLKRLSRDVDVLVAKVHMLDQHFAPDQDEAEIEFHIETFMQNTQLLIDNHFELQGIMLSVLAKLSIVKHQNFGIRCFETLKDLMKSGR